MNTESKTTEKTIDTLNSLLRGEISAVETYDQAINKVDSSGGAAGLLQRCRQSHDMRASRLREAVVARGGHPAEGSGAWGAFAKLMEGGATVLGVDSAVSLLEEGEDHGLKEYRTSLKTLDAEGQALVAEELLPEQTHTHEVLRLLKHA
ncbi:MAG: DUF2383 domain-containing protein [Deltaproteobacteria bacterium]|nr:DUF2383 domain-containing protein [Deltaproteobacteria bacterium]